MHAFTRAGDAVDELAVEKLARGGKLAQEVGRIRHDQLGGGARGRRAQVGGEIGDGEIDLVPDGRNHRHGEAKMARPTLSSLNSNRSSMLPPPRATTITSTLPRRVPGQRPAVEILDGAHDFPGGALALHADGVDEHPHPRRAAAQDVEHVLQRRASGRGHEADGLRESRERLFAVGVEKSFRLKLALECLEARLQRAQTPRLHELDHHLVLPARFIDRQVAEHLHLHPIGQRRAQPRARAVAERNARELVRSSLSVKYWCPELWRRKLEISPSTHTWPMHPPATNGWSGSARKQKRPAARQEKAALAGRVLSPRFHAPEFARGQGAAEG